MKVSRSCPAVNKQIGLSLKAIREARGLSQAEVCKTLKTAYNYLSRIEHGKGISIGRLYDFSKIYNFEVIIKIK
jgi:transcriptional regulator with XRE-family HTH domain